MMASKFFDLINKALTRIGRRRALKWGAIGLSAIFAAWLIISYGPSLSEKVIQATAARKATIDDASAKADEYQLQIKQQQELNVKLRAQMMRDGEVIDKNNREILNLRASTREAQSKLAERTAARTVEREAISGLAKDELYRQVAEAVAGIR